jgi:putative transposase
VPRANRISIPGQIWHITHRCHHREFLLRFARDRRRWRHWLFQARKRFGLCVLNYIATSNHVHLLVKDQGHSEIASSMQLIAGRTGQEYNLRKQRRGAFWEDRYHATAVDRDDYLARCMVYIDLNMVRAGAVSHPGQWEVSGFREIRQPPMRYRIIDLEELQRLLDIDGLERLQQTLAGWVGSALHPAALKRDPVWSESVAVGNPEFLEAFRSSASHLRHREISSDDGICSLREKPSPYEVGSA